MKYISVVALSIFLSFLASCKETDSVKEEDLFAGDSLLQTVSKYVSLGEHRTGAPADTATSYWLGAELSSYGYDVKYLEFPIRQFFPEKVFLAEGKDTLTAFPLWWVNESISRRASGALVASGGDKKDALKNIALIHLPLPGRKYKETALYLDSIISLGVSGIVIITDNPSGEIQAYNTEIGSKPWNAPIICIAPKDSAKAYSWIKQRRPVTLDIQGTFKDVNGRNVYGTIGKGEKYIVISTPISGWFSCGGERGSGIAIWLALAKWAARQKSEYTFIFTGNSGHEHAFLGAHQYLERSAPPKEKTHLWLHFGAGAATSSWKQTDSGLVKEATADNKRRFFYNEPVQASFEKAFHAIDAVKILENKTPGGELLYVAQKGYPRLAGVSYAHPFFHVRTDDANTTSPEVLHSTAIAFRDFLTEESR